MLEFGDAAVPPPVNDYGLRLVVDRKLWDLGTMVQQSPSLAGLAENATLMLAPADVEALRLTGSTATIDLASGPVEVPFVADAQTAPGTARVPFRLPGVDARDLMVAGQAVTAITVRPGGAQ